jgi:WD domain, G-beta repeat
MVDALTFSPDGRLLAAGVSDGTIHLWAVSSGFVHREFPGHNGGTAALAFTPDGRTLVSGGTDGVVEAWEVPTGTRRKEIGRHSGAVLGVAISRDGRRVASGGKDNVVLLHDLFREHNNRLANGTPRPEDLERAWADLTMRDAGRAEHALAVLARGPDRGLSFLSRKLRPAPGLERQQASRLIKDLDARRFTVRDKAMSELRALGAVAQPALRKALNDQPPIETRRRLGHLLELIETGDSAPEELRTWRLVEYLEQTGTAEAWRLLHCLASGAPAAPQTRAATAALRRGSINRSMQTDK